MQHRRNRSIPRSRRGLAALAAALTLVAACGDDGGEDEAAGATTTTTTEPAPSTTTTSTIAEYIPDPIAWAPCEDGLECAEVSVPLDYATPDGEHLPVAVRRAAAAGERTGALFVNPGGPGATDTGGFVSFLQTALPPAVTERFDLVTVDWRGTGPGDFDCGVTAADLYAVEHSVDSPDEEATLVDISTRYADGCAEGAGDLLAHLGTRSAARDVDAVRAAMGEETISYLGISYGTLLGQVYAEIFPDRVRAMVLDGVAEPGITGLDAATQQAAGFEQALEAFAAGCDAEPLCPLAPTTMTAVDDLIAQVEQAPIPGGTGELGPAQLSLGTALPLYSEAMWPDLAYGIDDALNGDGTGLRGLADQYATIVDFDIYFGVFCLDQEWPDDPADLMAAAVEAQQVSPHFGEDLVNDYIRCALWPVEADPLVGIAAPGAPPILVVSTTGDPATPHEAAVRVAENLETATLLTYEGEGHGAVTAGVPCIDDHVGHYLVNVAVPPDGTTC